MGMVKIGQKFSFSVTYDSPLLFVQAELYDDSGLSPILLATVEMENYAGNSYRGNFTPTDEMSILANIAVFTDGTFSVRDDNYSETDESFQVVELSPTVDVEVAGVDGGETLLLLDQDDETLFMELEC